MSYSSNVAQFLYFIAMVEGGKEAGEEEGNCYVKIGITNDPLARLAKLQTGCPLELILIGTVKPRKVSARALEQALHQLYSHLRVYGEWFNGNGEIWGGVRFFLDMPGGDWAHRFAHLGHRDGTLFSKESIGIAALI